MFFRETVLPMLVGIVPMQFMFMVYEEKVLKSDLKTWIKIVSLPIFIVIALSVVLAIGWILFIKIGI